MSFKTKLKSKYTLILLFLLLTTTLLALLSTNNINFTDSIDSNSNSGENNGEIIPDSSDTIYKGTKYDLSQWWDTRFRYRVGIEVEDLEGVDRYEPVDVYLTFQDNEHYEDSARLVSFNATGLDEWSSELPIQLWNVSYYPSGYIQSCTMTFLASTSANSNQTYFLYYNENLDNINPPSYNTNFQSSLSSGTLTVRVGTGSVYEAQLVEGQGVVKLEKDTIDFHGLNSLAPERRLTDPRLVLLAHMDENSGSSVSDASGYLNPGQINDNVNWAQGVVDYGLQFGGASNDTVSFGEALESSGDPFDDATTKWTMTCWVKPTSLSTAATNHGTQNVIAAKASDPRNDNFEIGIVGTAGADYGKVHVYLDTDNSDTQRNFGVGNDIVLNQWNFIALRVDLTKGSDHVEVRINDNWFGSGNQWSSAVTMDQAYGSQFTIGSSEHINQYYTGYIDEVAFYNDTLSDTEIEDFKYGSKTATIDSIIEILNGEVFSRYQVNWTDLFDMHVSDICSFYYDYNLWNINRTIYFDNAFDGTSTNTQMVPLNTHYDLSGLADSEDFYYVYDGYLEDRGLDYDDFTVENYTIIHDPIHVDEKLTIGMFVPNFYDTGPSASISYFKGNVTYGNRNDSVVYNPGYINDFNNNVGGSDNQLHIEFWEFIDNINHTAYTPKLTENTMEQLFENQFKALKNPVNLYIYEQDAQFFNLNVNVTDIDDNLVPGAKITVWNESNYSMNWTMNTDDSGEALFTRLSNGTYVVNATYERYGKAPLTITSPQTIVINESTVDSSGVYDLSFIQVHLTSLNLTLDRYNSTNYYQGKLNGAKVTFWLNDGTGAYLIGSENSDENGIAVLRWMNFTNPSDGNLTFAVEWFDTTPQKVEAEGDLDVGLPSENILNSTFYFYAENSTLVNVTFGPTFETDINFTVVPDPDFNQMLGDMLYFQVNFTYTENETITYPLTGATVNYNLKSGTQTINTQPLPFTDIGGGLYNLTIDTSIPIDGHDWLSERDYLVEVEASKPGFITEKISSSFILDPKSTTLVGNESSIGAYWGENLIMDVTYTDISFGGNNPIDTATVDYSVIGVPSVFGTLTPYGSNGRYQLILDSTDFPQSNSYTLQITANEQNYQEQSIFIDVTVLAIKSLINDSVGIYKTINVPYNEEQIFYFNYVIESSGTGLALADVLSYEWTEEIGDSIVDSGAGSLNDLGNGLYSLDFDTESREIATYTIIFNIEKENYAPRSGIIILNINPREFDVELPSEYFDENIVSGISGQDLTFNIDISDYLNGTYITDSQVYLTFEGKQYNFTSLGDGTYEITLDKDVIPDAFFLPQPVSAVITISKTNYETLNVPITVNVGMVELFGFPMFYFLMIVIGVAAVIGSLVTYRAIQKAKIPTFVKRTREISKNIKGRKSISDSLLYPSKQEYMIKKFGDKWEMLGLSLGDILGLESKKKKKLPEGGEM